MITSMIFSDVALIINITLKYKINFSKKIVAITTRKYQAFSL